MSGVYSYNKLFDTEYWMGAENLTQFNCVVHVDEVVTLSEQEIYEAAIENSWPEFIQDFCL